jgi:hypothetical protein
LPRIWLKQLYKNTRDGLIAGSIQFLKTNKVL